VTGLGVYAPVLSERPTGLGRFIMETTRPLLASDPAIFTQVADADWARDGRIVKSALGGVDLSSLAMRRGSRLAWLAGPVRKHVRREAVDVLYCPGQEGPLTRSGAAVCLVVHDLIGLRVPVGRHPLDIAQLRYLLPRMVSTAERVVTVSRSTRDDLLELTGAPEEKVVVVPPAVDHAVFWPRDEDVVRAVRSHLTIPPEYYLYAGTLSPHKNLTVVLDAMKRLRSRQGKRAPTLVVAGRSSAADVDRFAGEVSDRGLSADVIVTGYTSDDELAALMSGALGFVFPSLYEGFGLAPLEALACGAPVLVSNAASLPEVVGGAGVLLDPRDVDDWTTAMGRIATDRRQREELRLGATRRAARFRWSTTNERILDLLRDLGGG
jgi:glycosyltransferase involved in cell wall biosynthesis